MVKFIVEIPEPHKGHIVSSGGIRENGRMVSQFKNPIPYEEPTFPPDVVALTSSAGVVEAVEQSQKIKTEIAYCVIVLLLQELGVPIARACLRKLRRIIVNEIEGASRQLSAQHAPLAEPEMICIETDDIETIYNDGKIIHFPVRSVV